jgi:hypothetical protein
LAFQKSVKTPKKKKSNRRGAFFRNCHRMQKAPIKFEKLGRWDVALVLGGVLDVKKVGRALSRTGELLSGVEKWISGFH